MTTPVWSTPTNLGGTFDEGVPVNFQFVAANASSYQLIAGSLPRATLNNTITIAANGLMTGTPTEVNTTSVSNFVVRASNATSNTFADKTFAMTVEGPDAPGWITFPGNLATAQPNIFYNVQLEWFNSDPNTTTTFEVVNGVPPDGIEINDAGLIRGYANATVYTGNGLITALTGIGNNIISGFNTTFDTDFDNLRANASLYVNGNLIGTVNAVANSNYLTLRDPIPANITVLDDAYTFSYTETTVQCQVSSESGNSDIRSFTIPIANAVLPFSPVTWTVDPPTFNRAALSPYENYYISTRNLGTYVSNNYFAFKIIGHSYNPGDTITYSADNISNVGGSGLILDANTGWLSGNLSSAPEGVQDFQLPITITATSPISGTIVSNTANTTITGSNTQFTTQIRNNFTLLNSVGNSIGIVSGVANATSLTLSSNANIAYPSANLGNATAIANSNIITITAGANLIGTGDIISANVGASAAFVVLGTVANVPNATAILLTANSAVAATDAAFRVERGAIARSNSISQTFSLTVINNPDILITWSTPSDLGILRNGDTSDLRIVATTSYNSEIIYTREYLSLPPGLTLQPDGTIIGTVLFDDSVPVGTEIVYAFEARATAVNNPELYSIREFRITIVKVYEQEYETIYLKAYPSADQRDKINSMLSGVLDITVTSPGSGYSTSPPITLSPPQRSGGNRATANSTLSANDSTVANITVTNSGYGYTETPTVTVGTPWTPYGIVRQANTQYFSGNYLYTATNRGQFGNVAPNANANTTSGTVNLVWDGIAATATAKLTIPPESVFRPLDTNFGIANSIIYQHFIGINSSTYTQYLENINSYRANTQTGTNHYWKNITIGSFNTAIARDTSGNIIYEVVYANIIDNLQNANGYSISKRQRWPTQLPLPYQPKTTSFVYPNSLVNMRLQERQLGYINSTTVYPDWMTSQQRDGNTYGYIPSWVVCYTKPGESESVKENLENWLSDNNFGLNEVDFISDRLLVDKRITGANIVNDNSQDLSVLYNYTTGNIAGPGIISAATTSAYITGTNTNFTRNLNSGAAVIANNQYLGTVETVISDTRLKLTTFSRAEIIDSSWVWNVSSIQKSIIPGLDADK